MNTTQLGNVAIQNAGFKRSKFPMGKNLYTSCGFGEVSPVQCLQTDSGTATALEGELLAYLASINGPTYGHVNLELWHYFVQYTDLLETYPILMSQTAAQGIDGVVAPENLPNLPRNVISLLPLFFSHCTVYMRTTEFNGHSTYWCPIMQANTEGSVEQVAGFARLLNTHLSAGLPSGVAPFKFENNSLLGYKNISVDLRVLVDVPAYDDYHEGIYIPLSNPAYLGDITDNDATVANTLFEMHDADGKTASRDYSTGVDIAPVTIDGADFIIERKMDGFVYAFAFRLHAFGSRLFKVLRGTNWTFDFTDKTAQSLLPLFAVYKAYYSCFGLTLYENWNYTPAGRLLKIYDNASGGGDSHLFLNYLKDLSIDLNPTTDLFGSFIRELGSMWYTQSQDFISALTKSPVSSVTPTQSLVDSIGPHVGASIPAQLPSVTQPGVGGTNSVVPDKNEHAYINRIIHGHLDAETLKTLYQVTNRNSIAGKRIEELLRTQGLGKWVDSAKPRFIGHWKTPVKFEQEFSTANTFDGDNGAIIGERGGHGQAYDAFKKVHYDTDENGFVVSLIAVVPDAGYFQSHNIAYDCVKKEDFYLADFDGKGQELLPIKMVCGDMPVSLLEGDTVLENATMAAFGWGPRSAKFKVNFNTVSGDFAKRSKRKDLLTYNTDKFINLGETIETSNSVKSDGIAGNPNLKHREIEAQALFPVSEFPRAGLVWRYPTRYPWLGNFNRIFAAVGDDAVNYSNPLNIDNMFKSYEWVNNEEDGFDVMGTFQCNQYANKLPITDSYETREDGNKGEIDTNISKA